MHPVRVLNVTTSAVDASTGHERHEAPPIPEPLGLRVEGVQVPDGQVSVLHGI
jgi:hypothetical protein